MSPWLKIKWRLHLKKDSTAKEQEKVFRLIENNSILKGSLSSKKIEFSNVMITQDLVNTRGYEPCCCRSIEAQEMLATYAMDKNNNNAFERSPLFKSFKSAIVQDIEVPAEVLRAARSTRHGAFFDKLLQGTKIAKQEKVSGFQR